MSEGKPGIADDGADDHAAVRAWLESDDLARRIEKAARQRAEVMAARRSSGRRSDGSEGGDAPPVPARPSGIEPGVARPPRRPVAGSLRTDAGLLTRMAWARRRRAETLARCDQADSAPHRTDVVADVRAAAAVPLVDGVEPPSSRRIGSGDARDMLPPMVAEASPRDGRCDLTREPAPCRRSWPRLGTGGGFVSGLCACVLVVSVLSFLAREPTRAPLPGAAMPDVTLALSGMEWTVAAPPSLTSPARPAAGGAAPDAMRSGRDGLSPPARLAGLPSLPPRIDTGPTLAFAAQAPVLPVPPGDDPGGVRAAGLSGRHGATPPERARKFAALPAAAGPDPVPDVAPNSSSPGAIARQVRVAGPGASPPDAVASVAPPAPVLPLRRRDTPKGPRIAADRSDVVFRPDPGSHPAPVVLRSLGDVLPLAPGWQRADLPMLGRDRPATMPRTTAPRSRASANPAAGDLGVVTATRDARPLRAVVTASAGSARLDRLGLKIVRIEASPFPVASTRVHFFHAEDAGPAADLAAELGGVAVGLIGLRPVPPRGLLDIQLAD